VPVLVTRGSREPIVPPGWAQTATRLSSALASVGLRESGLGLLAALQSFGNLAASAIAGFLWTLGIRTAAFGYVAWMAVALVRLVAAGRCPTV
jgi:hypothetical protein